MKAQVIVSKSTRRGLAAFLSSTMVLAAFADELQADSPFESVRLTECAESIAITQGDKVVLVYNKQSPPIPSGIDPLNRRSGFLHPVASPLGNVVTATFPVDHPHQHGIFSAWVNTSFDGCKIDFWNLAGGTGRVVHESVVSKTADDGCVGFEVDLLHRTEGKQAVDVLRERWKVTLVTASEDFNCFDIESTQTALTDMPLTVHEYHYGGMAFRGPVAWLREKQESGARLSTTPSQMVNDLGSDRNQGNHEHAKWVALTGQLEGRPVSIAVLSHRDNFRAPQAARLHPSKPYFVFSPCVDGEFVIDNNHSIHNRYRYIVTDAELQLEWLNDQWNTWCLVR